MILPRYESAFLALDAGELQCAVQGLVRTRPELLELGDIEDAQTLLEFCRASHVSQAEVIMGMARMTTTDAISAVEKLAMRPIDRRSPAQVEREREAARGPRPVVQRVTATNLDDGRIIRLLVTTNPKRPGTASHDRFARYADGMTVAQALEVGLTRADLKWDQEHALIRIDDPTPSES